MGGMKDHFLGDTPAPYPASPGFKKPGTSQEAARATALNRLNARKRAIYLAIHNSASGLTADEAAAFCKESVLYARPRVAEMNALGLLVETGATRRNVSGLQASVWRSAK